MNKRLEFIVEITEKGPSLDLDTNDLNRAEILGCIEYLREAINGAFEKKDRELKNQPNEPK